MAPRAKSILKYGFSGVLTLTFLYIAFRGTDLEQLLEATRNANYWWIALMFVCLLVSHLLRSLRWRYLLDPIKQSISIRNLFSGVMIGYLMNNVLPRAGELVRPYSIGKLESIPKSAALGTIVVERIMDIVTFLVLILTLPLVYDGPLRETFPWLDQAGALAGLVTTASLAAMVVLVFRRDWADVVLNRFTKVIPSRFAIRVSSLAHSFLDGFLFLKHPGKFASIGGLSILIWLMYAIMMYVAFFAFDLQSYVGLRSAIVVLAISSIGVAIPTPGATGSYHVFTSQTLTHLFYVPSEIALSYATVTHAVGFVGVSVVGLYFLLKDHLSVVEAVAKPLESRE